MDKGLGGHGLLGVHCSKGQMTTRLSNRMRFISGRILGTERFVFTEKPPRSDPGRLIADY